MKTGVNAAIRNLKRTLQIRDGQFRLELTKANTPVVFEKATALSCGCSETVKTI